MQQFITTSPIGKIAVHYESDFILGVKYVDSRKKLHERIDPFAKEIDKQLQNYFQGKLQSFDLPFLYREGTDFQVRVWDQIRRIPFGTTRTYGQIANKIKSGPRAVGNACRQNHLLLIVPCHRVVSVTGLGGFMGDAGGKLVRRKQWLLDHEQEFKCAA